MEKVIRLVTFIFLFLFISVFNPPIQHAQAGVYHLVKKNETIWSISKAYGVPIQELVKVNNIIDINALKEDSVLFIPSACQVIDDATEQADASKSGSLETHKSSTGVVKDSASKTELTKTKSLAEAKTTKKEDSAESPEEAVRHQKSPDAKAEPQNKTVLPDKKISAGKNVFIWPVRGDVKARFGVQPNKTFNNWIKIISLAGKKIKAAESGTVIFSSFLKNYGETIIIKHKDDFATVYTHMMKRLVKIDKTVKKGEPIAVLGEKDEKGEVYMNFEIRVNGKAQNPLLFLP